MVALGAKSAISNCILLILSCKRYAEDGCIQYYATVGAAVAVDNTSKSAFGPSIFGTFFASAAHATEGEKQKEWLKAAATRHTGLLVCAFSCSLRINWRESVCSYIAVNIFHDKAVEINT